MKPKKKSGLFTFLCSFFPGAAEMYMGFMKMGLSLTSIFILSFMFPALFRASDVFICIAAVIWVFGFFHARNIAAAEDDVFEKLQDRYIWEEFTDGKQIRISQSAGRKWFAAVLILLGAGILWSSFSNLIYDLIPDYYRSVLYPIVHNIPQTLIAVIIIIVGIRMIMGKKEELDGEYTKNP